MKPTDKFVRKISVRRQVTSHHQLLIENLSDDVRSHRKGDDLVNVGDQPDESLLIVEGLAVRYKDMSNGRRQILELNLPGDFIDLHAYALNRLDHAIMVLSDAKILHVPHQKIANAIAEDVKLSEIFWHQTVLDAAIHREWVCSLGIRPAAERLAAFFCELTVRLSLIGEVDDFRFPFAMNQAELAEICGMTHVHVNRTLIMMDKAGLIRFRHEEVEIHNWAALKEMAEFNYVYLDLPDGHKLPFED